MATFSGRLEVEIMKRKRLYNYSFVIPTTLSTNIHREGLLIIPTCKSDSVNCPNRLQWTSASFWSAALSADVAASRSLMSRGSEIYGKCK